MQSLYDVAAPAKLNLFLHVTGRRSDGYHLLQSVFMLLDWCDTLHFDRRADGRISREDLGLSLPPDDLTLRAARALQQVTGCALGAHIGIEKRLPSQAGMGGGSSDAASCLLALNRLWGLGLSTRELAQIGLQLGADVPFFIDGRNAWVEGIGDKIHPLELPPARFVVIKPPAGLETSAIFADPDLPRDTNTATIAGFAADPYGFGRNDLQGVALRKCPQIGQALDWLASQGLDGRMTGSGSAVFARLLNDTDRSAGSIEFRWERSQALPANVPEAWQIRTCSNLSAHPLLGWAGSDD